MCIGGSRGDGGAAEAKRAEEARQARIRKGSSAIDDQFSQFDDAFYDKRKSDYLNYAKPQAQSQYEDAFKDLTLKLAEQNLLNSSAGARRRAKLLERRGEIERQIGSSANELANNARSNIQAAKSDLQNQNINIANPSLVASNAAARAQQLNQTPTFDPLINLFANAAEGLATQADLERRGKNRYNTPLFNFGGSGKVVS